MKLYFVGNSIIFHSRPYDARPQLNMYISLLELIIKWQRPTAEVRSKPHYQLEPFIFIVINDSRKRLLYSIVWPK